MSKPSQKIFGLFTTSTQVHFFKSRKHESEIAHIRHAMVKDGVALCHFFHWLKALHQGQRISELTIDEKITAFRAQQEGFIGPSFQRLPALMPMVLYPTTVQLKNTTHLLKAMAYYSLTLVDNMLTEQRILPVLFPSGHQQSNKT